MLSLLLISKWCLERASAANFSHQSLTFHHIVIFTFRMIIFLFLYRRQCACVPETNNSNEETYGSITGMGTAYAHL